MPTVAGVVLFLLAVLPGALLVWSFERIAGHWAIGLTDRFLRFITISAVLQVAFAPATYAIWHEYLRTGAPGDGQKLPLWLWAVAFGYVALPVLVGTLLAVAVRRDYRWTRHVGITLPPPTAWDAVFSGEPAGWVLMRLKSGRLVGGEYAEGSYTGGYPEPGDIFLSVECEVDQDIGEFVLADDGMPRALGGVGQRYGLLVRWEEIEYLELTPTLEEADE
jgi:hypothetical protein